MFVKKNGKEWSGVEPVPVLKGLPHQAITVFGSETWAKALYFRTYDDTGTLY